MFEGFRFLLSRSPVEILRDLFDILVVAFIVYRALLVLKGTRAMQMGIGFVAFGLLYLLAKYTQLATLMSVLSWLASSAILVIVVVFQNDIRRALIRVGSKAWLTRRRDAQERVIEEVVAAATELARHRMGALICLERDANVLEFVKNEGLELDSMVSRELIVSLFIPESVNKTHDGAVLVRDLRIARAGIFFQMPETTRVADPTLGSRHRAAIGITEETDAIVIAVSEERGTITLVFKDGTMVPNLTGAALQSALLGLFGRVAAPRKRGRSGERARSSSSPRVTASPAKSPNTEKTSGEKTSGEKTTGEKTTGEKTSGEKTSGEKTSGEKTSGEKASGEKASGEKAKVRATNRSASARTSRPPSALPKPTARSGGFRALKPGDADKAAPPRVSVPMPSSKDRKSSEPEEATATPPPASMSKPMTPTDLPTTTLRGDDK